MKAIELLQTLQQTDDVCSAIEELTSMLVKYKELEEYYWYARNHLATSRCSNCGSLYKQGLKCKCSPDY